MSAIRGRRVLLAAAFVWGVLAVPSAGADHAPGTPGTVSAAEDQPSGCRKATGEDTEGCGARGRDHFGNAGHRPPVRACADRRTAGGGRITRILPDGPRRADGSPAFVTGACVYLPPGYERGDLRYPTMYLLHGGGGDQADWVTFGEAEEILDRRYAADPTTAMIAVMPDGRSGQWYDWEDGSYRFETYVLDHVVPYVDSHYRTIADRRGRVIAGLSNGGYGTLHLAGKRPDLFVAAGAMSSNIGARLFSGLGPADAVHYQGSVPLQLAQNYDEVDLIVDLGTTCVSDLATDLCATIAVDLLFFPDHLLFEQEMRAVGHRGVFDNRYTEGAHAWRWWTTWLEQRDLPFFHARVLPPRPVGRELAPAPIPESFRYRSIAPRFEVWDHVVEVDRRVREFLDLTDVTARGFTVQGSGTATVTTAPRYRPGTVLTVAGAGGPAREVVADRDGRLTVAVDLGPSHQHDQFTPEARLAEAAGGYWTTRKVTLTPTDRRAPAPPAVEGRGGPAATGSQGIGGSRGAERSGRAGGRVERAGEDADAAGAVGSDGGAADRARPSSDDTVTLGADEVAAPEPVADRRRPWLVPLIAVALLLAAAPAAWLHRRRPGGEAS